MLIPLASSAGNEQAHNARHLAEAGAAVALLGEVTADQLRKQLLPLLQDGQARLRVAAAAAGLGRPDAAGRMADVLLAAAGAPVERGSGPGGGSHPASPGGRRAGGCRASSASWQPCGPATGRDRLKSAAGSEIRVLA